MPLRTVRILAVFGIVGVLALLFVLISENSSNGPSSDSAPEPGTSLLPPGTNAPDFHLKDIDGANVSLRDYRGQVVLLTFLPARCGASCVLVTQQIRGALDDLRQPVAALAISTDPSADTPARARRMLEQSSLNGRLRYLSGSTAQLEPVWRAYRLHPSADGSLKFDARTTLVLLIDRHGQRRAILPPEQLSPESLAEAIRALQRESP